MTRPDRLLTLAALAALAACSGGGGGSSNNEVSTGGDFLVLKTDPVNGQQIYLNDPVRMDFSAAVDLDTASLSSVTFQALDQLGVPVQELVTGNFALEASPGDLTPGRRLTFVPTFATNNSYGNGGFRAGRTYMVQLVGGTSGTTSLRSLDGKPLRSPTTFQFTTREGTQPAQLYRNPAPGGPRRVGFEVSTADDLQNVPLGLFGAPPLEVRLHFDQALNPNNGNVPVAVATDPLTRDENLRGRVWLEYEDVDNDPGEYTWIPADAEIERNDLSGATLALRPLGVLPNNAEIRVIVESTLEDIAGESNAANPSYDRVFATFRTTSGYEQQWNAIVEEFDALASIDLGAAFPESQAEVGPGYIKAGFAFEGNSTTLEYQPTANEVVLNTSFTQVVPANGLPFTVSGGVFNFRNVTIPQGVTVSGQGPNPMVWLCSGRFTVAGTLSVRGGNGARVDTLNSANFAKAGGIGGPGGGNGGDGTPSATQRDQRGGTGRGPRQAAGKGGRGGYLACQTGCYTGSGYNSSGGGSGGGGGTLATQGDPNYRWTQTGTLTPNVGPTANTVFQQRRGFGGTGCSGGAGSRTFPAGQPNFILRGGEPGDLVFVDARPDNNFWGSAINLSGPGSRTLRITGELPIPVGGGGGGGGGDTSHIIDCGLLSNNPANDYSGGGGGGGGGVVIVKALEEIVITSSGRITADGGNGGGGEQVGSCGEAGGGGAGAGGMVILMSAKGIIIEAHGTSSTTPPRYCYGAPAGAPFGGNDYSFAVSADGGVCTTGGFGAVNITGKYPAAGSAPLAGNTYDQDPLGALGGMGIVQLMVPPGPGAEPDDTNTLLDDNITFYHPNTYNPAQPNVGKITGAGKQQLLGWRGFALPTGGLGRNDAGVEINLGDNEGDIRPSPTLLPCPFSARSRARSTWIDTGLSQRRPLTAEDGNPRGIVTSTGAVVGPVFEFAGTKATGYVDYDSLSATALVIDYPTPVSATALLDTNAQASFLGKPAYRIRTVNPVLGEANRYVQYEAQLLNQANSVLAGFRILSHTANELLVDPGSELLPEGATKLQVRAKFFKVVTNNAEGLGPVYQGEEGTPPSTSTVAVPTANVRIGFAFHQDPDPTNILAGRYPSSNENTFVFDLNDPGLQAWILANGQPRYVQWDVMFDMAYQPTITPAPSLRPTTPRPELHYLRLPFRF